MDLSKKGDILDTAIRLIAKDGFESVSMRNIAAEAGVKSSSVYCHYENKQQILDEIYDYYIENFSLGRLPEEEMKRRLREGNRQKIVDGLASASFVLLEKPVSTRMMLISRIVYSRIYCDSRAAEVFRGTTGDARRYIREAVEYGIGLGRFGMLDAEGFARSFVALSMNMGIMAFCGSVFNPWFLNCEERITQWTGSMLGYANETTEATAAAT